MASAFPINWKFGGIAWNRSNGVISLYVALRFGLPNGARRPIGFIARVGPKSQSLYSSRKRIWCFGRFYLGAY